MGRSSIEAGFQPSPVFEQQVALSTGDAITLFIHERERDRQRKGSTGLFDQATRQPPVRLHPVRFRKRRAVLCVNQPVPDRPEAGIVEIASQAEPSRLTGLVKVPHPGLICRPWKRVTVQPQFGMS